MPIHGFHSVVTGFFCALLIPLYATAAAYRDADADVASRCAAADNARISRAEFGAAAKRDRGLKVEASNKALYLCEAPQDSAVGTDNIAHTGAAAFPLDQTYHAAASKVTSVTISR